MKHGKKNAQSRVMINQLHSSAVKAAVGFLPAHLGRRESSIPQKIAVETKRFSSRPFDLVGSYSKQWRKYSYDHAVIVIINQGAGVGFSRLRIPELLVTVCERIQQKQTKLKTWFGKVPEGIVSFRNRIKAAMP